MPIADVTEVADALPSGGLVTHVYETVRREILTGRLRPNQALVEAEIAERLGVSRMPVRESLQRLALDGLVSSLRRRWVVHEHTREEIREIYEVRAALEGRAASLACERATEAQRAAMLRVGRGEVYSRAATREERVKVNSEFHQAIAEAAGNERLRHAMERNSTFYFNFNVASHYSQADLDESGAQHEALTNAILGRDASAAASIAEQHVAHALGIILHKMFP